MKIKDILDELNNDSVKATIEKWQTFHESYWKNLDDIKSEKLKDVILGPGIASINGTLSGLRDEKGRDDKNSVDGDNYITMFNKNLPDIIKTIKEWNDFSSDDYKKLIDYLPVSSINNITNRFIATLHKDKLTTIAGFNQLCDVLEFIGEKPIVRNDRAYWLPYSIKLRELINDNASEDWMKVPEMGWKLVEYISSVVKNREMLEKSSNVILTGAPGTGKTYLAKQIAAQVTRTQVETDEYKNRVGFVQFHPSYDYSDFVEGLRPVKDAKSNIGFERKDGVFKAFCKKALYEGYIKTNEGKWEYIGKEAPRFVFIIDEINRGEMSKIFGELFFSIDPGYRGTKGRIKTQYQNLVDYEIDANEQKTKQEDVFKDGFFVPENVYIIGTMNDIDRSVESMDFAMRRRFTFKEVRATDREYMLDEVLNVAKADEAKQRMYNLNYRIQEIEVLNEAYHVGPAYFTKVEEDGGFPQLWENRIKGLLCEYLRGMPNAKELIESLKRAYKCTDDYVENKNGELKLRKASLWQNNIVNKPKKSKNANIGDGEDDSSEG